jgi:glycine/D-amino acid oxidase-like deaminating enzyme
MIDELMPFARIAYGEIGTALGAEYMTEVSVVDFFPSAQMRLAFMDRLKEDPGYLQLPADEYFWNGSFRYELGYGQISPCYLVDLPGLLGAMRRRLRERGLIWEEKFERGELRTDEAGVHYRDISAGRAIFCDGIESFANPFFSRLPFAPNKGEALIVGIPGLAHGVYKKGMTLAPWGAGKDGQENGEGEADPGKDLFWLGSSYEWSFEHDRPTEVFRQRAEASLREWLKLPFQILDHIASVRPATLERRPFVGWHPSNPVIGILNGMGTKGCSLAPFFANQLVENIRQGAAIRADADVKRFTKVLSR